MSEHQQADLRDDDWLTASNAARSLALSLPPLRSNPEAAISAIRKALRGPGERRWAMVLLSQLGSEFTEAVLPELVRLALSHRDALIVRQLIGQLPYERANKTVPPVVWEQLDETGDDDAFRRLAELLRHLGLKRALLALCDRAARSEDSDIREVASDFHPDLQQDPWTP